MQTLYHVILYLTNCFINCTLIYVAVLAYDTCSILQNDTKKKTQFKPKKKNPIVKKIFPTKMKKGSQTSQL